MLFKLKIHFRLCSFQVKQKKVKTVIPLRNPKDVLVSYYHFYQLNKFLGCYDRSWEEFFQLFQKRQLAYGDILDHIQGYWENCRNLENVLFVYYEEAQSDIVGTLKKISTFLGKNLSDQVLHDIAKRVNIKEMKVNSSVNYNDIAEKFLATTDSFIRKGGVGGWQTYFNEDQSRYVNEHYVKPAQEMGIVLRGKITENI